MTLFLALICMAAVAECSGFNYYWPYPGSQDIVAIPQFAPIQGLWPPPVDNCDKKENVEEGGSSESSSSESSESSSSESSSSESGESKESGEEKGEGEGEGEGSKEESKSSSEEEEGSSSSEEEEKKEGGEESGEEPKKKKKKEEKGSKPFFPSYLFPPRPAAVYAPSSSYSLLPYRTSYVIQRPATTYPMKSGYQYVMPSSSAVYGGYNSPVTYSRIISNPVAKLAYSAPTIGYPTIAKTYVAAPSANVYSVPATSLAFIKK